MNPQTNATFRSCLAKEIQLCHCQKHIYCPFPYLNRVRKEGKMKFLQIDFCWFLLIWPVEIVDAGCCSAVVFPYGEQIF